MGRRVSIQLTTGFLNSLLVMPAMVRAPSADRDLGVVVECVGRQEQIEWRRPVPHPAGGVVLAAVAGAEPAAPVAARIGRLVAQRDAAQMRADADQHDPL